MRTMTKRSKTRKKSSRKNARRTLCVGIAIIVLYIIAVNSGIGAVINESFDNLVAIMSYITEVHKEALNNMAPETALQVYNRDRVASWCKGVFSIDENIPGKYELSYYDWDVQVAYNILEYCQGYKDTERFVFVIADDGCCVIDKESVSYQIYTTKDDIGEELFTVFENEKRYHELDGFPF